MKHYTLSLLAASIMAGCASMVVGTNVLPMENNEYKIVATGPTQDSTMEVAMDKAEEVCESKGLKPYIRNDNSQYVGVDKDLKATVQTAQAIAFYSANFTGPGSSVYFGPSTTLNTASDYKVEIVVKCK